jgi:hypothetical protein
LLTGGRSSPARNMQEAIDGKVSVVGDDGRVADVMRKMTTNSKT